MRGAVLFWKDSLGSPGSSFYPFYCSSACSANGTSDRSARVRGVCLQRTPNQFLHSSFTGFHIKDIPSKHTPTLSPTTHNTSSATSNRLKCTLGNGRHLATATVISLTVAVFTAARRCHWARAAKLKNGGSLGTLGPTYASQEAWYLHKGETLTRWCLKSTGSRRDYGVKNCWSEGHM